MTRDWGEAYRQTSERIVAHPAFRRLVREVAVAEQPSGARRWLRLNSPTYGHWMTRGMSWPGRRPKGERAWGMAQTISDDLDLYEGRLPRWEGRARVYGEARDYVRARRLPHP